MLLSDLENYTGQLLAAADFHDYCPNGLQVEGRSEVRSLVSGVSASFDLLRAAVDLDADAVLVHHGYFWKNEDPCVIGVKRRRLELLLRHNMSLLAYHLPLDAHPGLGNNAQLAAMLGLLDEGGFEEQNIGRHGVLERPQTLAAWTSVVAAQLQRIPLVIGDESRVIRRVAWCSGGAQDYFTAAVKLGVDAFLTGEISEHNVHLARESGVAFISAGHYATERYGVQALGDHLARHFGLQHQFVDIPNPV